MVVKMGLDHELKELDRELLNSGSYRLLILGGGIFVLSYFCCAGDYSEKISSGRDGGIYQSTSLLERTILKE